MIHGLDETIIASYTIKNEVLFYDAMTIGNIMGFRLKERRMLVYPLLNYYNFAFRNVPNHYYH
jgi:hypothetical protein